MLRTMCALSVLVAIVGCGGEAVGTNGSLVGGPCAGNADCEYRCELGGDFPQGTCVRPCNVDADCPDGTYCVDKEGGICLLGCEVPADCRGGYNCEGQRNRGHGGDSLVCIN
ncbi:MAG: hypothetical protein SFX73_29825 [Kofleriaceae bacterium]|nr:hypothetical protein [Kofleriaceae bacterium]